MDLLPRARLRLACVAFLICAAVPAFAAERVSVSGGVAGGAGHLEFVWPQEVEYDARVVFGRLLVRFSAPGEFDFSAFQGAMPQFLGDPTVVADGTVVAFPLQVPVSLRHSQDGSRISIELFDEQGLTALSTAAGPVDKPPPTDLLAPPVAETLTEAPAAPAAEAAAEPATEAPAEPVAETPAEPAAVDSPPLETSAGPTGGPTVGLRVGEHPGYSRLVFDWPSQVAYRIDQRGRRVIIVFDAAAHLDLSNFRLRPSVNVSDITTEAGATGLTVTLILPAQYLVRHFLDGSHLVVDVVEDGEAAQLAPGIVVSELVPRSDTPPASAPESTPVSASAPEAVPVPPVTEEPLAPTGEAGGAELPRSLLGEAGEDQAPAGLGVLALAERQEIGHADPATATAVPVSSRQPFLLQFEWPSNPGRAAVFRRGRHLWIAFDQPLAEAVDDEIAEAVPDLAPVERLTDEAGSSATILRLNLPWAFVPELRRADHAWTVELQARADEPATPLTLEYLTDTTAPSIRFSVDGSEDVMRVRDPDLGDTVEIVPVPVAGLGLKRERRFLQFRALATYQGLAIIPLSDSLIVESGGGGVVVRDAAGLLISPGADRDRALRNNKDFESGVRLNGLEAGRHSEQAEGGGLEARDPILAAKAEGNHLDSRLTEREREVAAAHAVRALLRAVSDPPNSLMTAEATAQRNDLFTGLFLGEPGERFAPLTAFTLYQQFKDLTPAGSDGDRLIARLADRLVEADKLDQAAQLLDDQVTHRLHGEAKVLTGTRLAVIRLLEGKPVPALTALNATLPEDGFASLPVALERDRRHLRSRALASLGRSAEARALLAGDESEDALRLQAELFWAEKDWTAMAGTLEKLAPPPTQGLPLSETDGEVLLNLAVAYGLSGRRDQVSRITDRYGAALAGTAWRDEFALLASASDKAELIARADKLSGPARMEAFKVRYRERLAPDEANYARWRIDARWQVDSR
jgi:hypothetical protein